MIDQTAYLKRSFFPYALDSLSIKVIKELSFVDRVISYNNTDQSELLKELTIDIFVIGPDYGYSIEHKNTINYCKKNNINIIINKRTEGISTTEIINKILNK